MVWSYLALELSCGTRYSRKDRRGREDDKEDLNSYWMTLTEKEDTEI